jgi:hypothetical protein
LLRLDKSLGHRHGALVLERRDEAQLQLVLRHLHGHDGEEQTEAELEQCPALARRDDERRRDEQGGHHPDDDDERVEEAE